MIDVVIHIFQESATLWLAMAPYILLGMFFAGILHAFLGEGFISRHLGGKGVASIIKATLFGIPLPICSCGVIPVAASLKNEGASKSSVKLCLIRAQKADTSAFYGVSPGASRRSIRFALLLRRLSEQVIRPAAGRVSP